MQIHFKTAKKVYFRPAIQKGVGSTLWKKKSSQYD